MKTVSLVAGQLPVEKQSHAIGCRLVEAEDGSTIVAFPLLDADMQVARYGLLSLDDAEQYARRVLEMVRRKRLATEPAAVRA